MEEEKPQSPAAHQIDGAVTANVAAGVHMQEAVAADQQCLDAAAAANVSDEALAHALHMEDLLEMTESQLRACPSFVPAGGQDRFCNFSGAGVQYPFANYSETSGQGPFANFSGTGGQDRFSNFSQTGGQDPYANFSGTSAGGQDPFANFSRAGIVQVQYPFANFSETGGQDPFANFSGTGGQDPFANFSGTGGQDPFSNFSGARVQDPFSSFSGAGGQDPFANFSRTGGQDPFANFSVASAGAQATTETEFDFLPRYDEYDDDVPSPSVPLHQSAVAASSSGPMSSGDVPGDDVVTLPSETLISCVASPATCTLNATALARPIVPVDDVVSSKRRALLADADAQIILAGMAEGHENGWYESIISDAADEELEQMEELGLRESLRQCLPRRYEAPKHDEPHNTTAAVAGEEDREFCVQKFCNKWSISLSDLAPDEPGPSTKRAKVPALADDEVPKFDCGICMETLDVFDLFHGMLCRHKFCTACMEAYVEGRIREGNLPIPCPDPACKSEDDGILHPEKCKKAIDFAAFGDWGVRLTERAVPANRRAYCPNRQCGVLLETSGEQKPAKAPCPACKHLLCAACGMEWSADGSGEHDCTKGPDAALVMKLAAERRWKQCPRCKMIVERIDGCNTMTCRCHCVFCYRCGRPLTPPQAEEVGSEPCRCNHAGLAFAFAHHHQVHLHPHLLDADDGGEGHVPQQMAVPPPPPHDAADDDDQDLHGVHAFDLNDDGGDPAHQQDEI